MCRFISEYFQRHAKEKKRCEELHRTYSSRINYLVESEQALFADTLEKVDIQANARWTENTAALIEEMKSNILPQMRKAKSYKELKASCALLEEDFHVHPLRVREHDQLAKEIKSCKEMAPQLEELLARFNQFLQKNVFITPEQSKVWADRFKAFRDRIDGFTSQQITQNQYYITLRQNADRIQRELSEQIDRHNADVYQRVIGKVEGRNLDKQQLSGIVKSAHNHLVLAGAGTGKTTTVVGKVKYLLGAGLYAPEDILVLSFTNDSASEMNQRIRAETGANIAASTFHKLGLNIITKVDGIG